MRGKNLHTLFRLLVLLCAAFRADAQFCPTNINFENGNLNYWKFYIGYNNGASGLSTLTNTTPITNRHTLTSGTATDYYGGFPIVDPNGGSYSLKLGNDNVGSEADQARYTFTVPASINNYSLIYRYAVVLENPSHNYVDQPFFRVRVYDSATGNIINCASFLYVSQSSLPGFSTSPNIGNHTQGAVVYYKPWATASLNLTGQAGKTLVVEFTAADCALGAHMGYGYVDVSCGLFAITSNVCTPTTPLTAPPGFQTYTWYNANYTQLLGTGQTITLATPTTLSQYHVVLTPYTGYGCQDTLSTTVIGSTLALQPMPDTMLCNNSSITLNPAVTGNVPPFTYNWSPATGLSCTTCANPVASPTGTTSYILTVTDSFGCVKRDTVTVTARVALSTTTVNATCSNAANGSAIATASSGTAPYTYSWNTTPVKTGATATGLSPGTYTVTATDAKGCTATSTVTIGSPPVLVAAITTKDSVSCYGGNDGKATATATGGAPPYTYSWNTTPAQTTAMATGLSGGVRVVTVTDANGCTDTESVSILQPAPLMMNIGKTAVLCNGDSTGTATITGGGGTPPYTYAVDTRAFGGSNTLNGLNAGTHILHLKDAHGCTLDSTIVITQPTKVTISYTLAQPLCYGGTNGAITVSASGGVSPYRYAIGTGSYSSNTAFTNLAAGTYILHAKDTNGCIADSAVALGQPTPVAAAPVGSSTLCYGTATGSVSVAGSGGISPYTYAIDAGSYGSSTTFSGLSAGTHTVHVKDANGCIKDSTVIISQPTPVSLSYTATQPLCNGVSNGTITITGTGGTPGYQYAINAGTFGSTSTFTGLAAGTHTLHVKDANGCTKDSIITLAQPALVSLGYIAAQPLCNGASNGTVTITGTGGTAPYQYALNSGSFGAAGSFTGLAAGTHTLHVKDANNCTKDSIITLGQPAILTATASKTNVTCYGGANGTAQVMASGGTSPYTYSWTGTSQTTASVTGLSAGTYTVTVTDAKGCTYPATVTITQPTAITATSSAVAPVCNNTPTGSGAVTVSGGTGAYTYTWNTTPIRTTAAATGLNSGTYTVTITDAAGCQATATVVVPTTPAIVVSIAATTISCNGGKDGTATASVFNGTTPYTYAWSTTPVQTGVTATGLGAGIYTLTVTSANGCIGTGSVNVPEPAPLNVKLVSRNTCPGFAQGVLGSTVSGGNSGYTYQWNTTPVQTTAGISGLLPGTYFLKVTDSKGCVDTISGVIGLFTPPQVDAGPDQELCTGRTAMLSASGAQTYEWSPGWQLSCTNCTSPGASPSRDTTYTVIGTDINGCKDTDQVHIAVIQHVPVSVGQKQIICEGDSVRLGASGGISWEWLPPVTGNNNSSSPIVRPVATTTYQVVITENQCFRDTLTQTVEVLPMPAVDLGPDLEAPNGTVIHLNAAVTNANAITWTPEAGLSCTDCYTPEFTLHGKTTYIARVTNILGCAATDTINIKDVCGEHSFFFPNVFTPNGDGSNDRFFPQGVGTFPVQHFMIYDRWGEIVFSAANIAVNDPAAGWDGTFKGVQVKPDVYVYVMDALCENGQKVVLRGDVTLIR
jgi:gliding motility-associated-like protein